MKDAYYFSHDSNAKDDPKCVLLIEQLGMEGYGIYWMLVETLRDQPNYKYPVILIPALARRYNTTAEKVKTVVFNYSLFMIEKDEFFFSDSLMRRMEKLEDKREKARIAGQASAKKRINGRSTDVQQTFNDGSTSKVKESILNESKGEERVTHAPPDFGNPFLSIESIKERLQQQSWVEQVCLNMGFNESEFKNHLKTWISKKELTGDYNYPIQKLRLFAIDDYQKIKQNGNGNTNKSKIGLTEALKNW